MRRLRLRINLKEVVKTANTIMVFLLFRLIIREGLPTLKKIEAHPWGLWTICLFFLQAFYYFIFFFKHTFI